jgi:transposase
MEDVLELYAEPYDVRRPQVCFEESPVQLISETRHPLPARPGQPARYDYEYRRAGTANLFLFVQPVRGWRHVNVTAHRTKHDFAVQMQELVDVHFPEADVIRLVVDNLNPHTPAALYETFAPAEARRITRKLGFHYTPKHGSWLNMADCEFAVLTEQCLDRRIALIAMLCQESTAWQAARNHNKAKINGRFHTTDARITLKRLYPSTSRGEQLPEIELMRAA